MPELDRHRARRDDIRAGDDGHHLRALRLVERDDDDTGIAADPGVCPGNRDAAGSPENPAGIEGHGALEEVVERIAVEERPRPDEDEPLLEIGDIEVGVHLVNAPLVVGGIVSPRRIWGERRRGGHAGGVGRLDVELLPERGHRRRRDPLRETLVVDESDVVDAQAVGAAGGVEILTAGLHLEHLALLEGVEQPPPDVAGGVTMGDAEGAVGGDVLGEIVREGDMVERAAEDGLRLLLLGHRDAGEAPVAEADPRVAADEVGVVRPLHQQLRHDGVVVLGLGDVAVGAHLRFVRATGAGGLAPVPRGADGPAADGVGDIRAEGDAAEALRRDRLLLDIDRLPARVVGADMDRAAGTRRADAVAGGVAVTGEHEDVVAQRLEVVGDEVPRHVPLVVERRGLLVGPLRQVAAEAARVPRAVAGDAAHVFVGMGAAIGAGGAPPLHRPVLRHPDGLGEGGEGVVVIALGIDRRLRLLDLPGQPLLDHRVLEDPVPLNHEPTLAGRRAQIAEIAPPLRARSVGGRPARPQAGESVDGAVAIDAADLDRGAHLAVQPGVAVGVLNEVAVDAVHPLLHVDVEEMDREPVALGGDLLLLGADFLPRLSCRAAVDLLDPLRHRHRRPQRRIAGIRDRLAAVIKHHPPAVMLEDRPVGPSVAVEIGELRVLRAVVEVGEIGEELRIGEPVLRRRFVRVGERDVDRLFRGRIALLVRVDQIAVGFFVPPHVADVAVHHRRAGMDVADDALAGGDPAPGGEAVLDRMAALPTRDHRIDREALATVAELRVRPGMDGGAVVGVDHMAAGAAAGAVVAGMVVGAEEVERRIEEPRLREAHEHRIGAVLRSQAPRSQPGPRPPRLLEALGVAGVGPEAPAALEDPQDVPRLHPLEPRQGIEIADHPLEVELLGRRWRHVLQPLADAIHAVALAVGGVLHGDRAVVVEGGVPEHAAVGHHALTHLEHLRGVASAAADVRHP